MWEARDPATRRITAADLERIGRVTGALTRHADNVVAGLPASQRVAVRRLLMRLVTIEDTRASLPLEDLVLGDANNETALEALVRGRLVVVREAQDGTVYEIAHEALIRNWDTLQRWITEERETREVYHRLEIAALEWQRLGGGRDGLWTADQRAEADRLDRTNIRQRERDFLDATQTELIRRRWVRRGIFAAIPLVLFAAYLVNRVQDGRAMRERIDQQLTAAAGDLVQARATRDQGEQLRRTALTRFDSRDVASGESLWAESLVALAESDAAFKLAARKLETALSLDGTHPRARTVMAELLLDRARLAERQRNPDLASELIERLKLYDDGKLIARWNAPGQLTIRLEPPSARATVAEYSLDKTKPYPLSEPRDVSLDPAQPLELTQGSYLLRFTAEGHEDTVYPVLVGRGDQRDIRVSLPPLRSIPAGFVYVPGGGSLFGSDTPEQIRKTFFTTAPLHEVDVGGFIAARTETTYADWIAFLDDIPPDRRRLHTLLGDEKVHLGSELAPLGERSWQLTITSGDFRQTVRQGEPLIYRGRTPPAPIDWSTLPASGIRWDDAVAYLAWLDSSGRVPGARFCNEWEWERAIRGADGRSFPHGERLFTPDEANIDVTHGKDAAAMGPDPAGSHPASNSPFGLSDGAGSVWEWVTSSLVTDERVVRSGAFFYDEVTAIAFNRYIPDPNIRDSTIGLRACASWPPAK